MSAIRSCSRCGASVLQGESGSRRTRGRNERCSHCGFKFEHDLDCGQIHVHITGPWVERGGKTYLTCCSQSCWCQPPVDHEAEKRDEIRKLTDVVIALEDAGIVRLYATPTGQCPYPSDVARALYERGVMVVK